MDYFNWIPQNVFQQKKLWNTNGLFNNWIVAVYVAQAKKVKLTFGWKVYCFMVTQKIKFIHSLLRLWWSCWIFQRSFSGMRECCWRVVKNVNNCPFTSFPLTSLDGSCGGVEGSWPIQSSHNKIPTDQTIKLVLLPILYHQQQRDQMISLLPFQETYILVFPLILEEVHISLPFSLLFQSH